MDHSLHLVLNVERFPLATAQRLVADVAAAGVTVVQLRCKTRTTREFVSFAEGICEALGTDVPLVIDDRTDIALAVGAIGVHLGRDDMPFLLARRLFGPDNEIGATLTAEEIGCRNLEERLLGATYVGIGPVHPTVSKLDAPPPMGLDGLRGLARRTHLPAVAIGGITSERVEAIMATGVCGIAVVSAICESESPTAAAADLSQRVHMAIRHRGDSA